MMARKKEKEEARELIDLYSFQRLKITAGEILEKEAHLTTLKETLDDEDGLYVKYRKAKMMSISIQEKEFKCKALKKKIEMVQKLILAKRRIMYELKEKIAKKKNDELKLKEKTDGLAVQVAENAATKQKTKKVLHIMTRLCAYRKAHLLQEVMEIFKIEIDGGPASMQAGRPKRDCKCLLYDTIRGLHLPHVASIQQSPHNEIETTAAIGLLIQMLDIISRILEYPLRYPVIQYSSSSRILCPAEEKVATLSGWKRRFERERFFEGLGWVGKNIAQLRSDCGIPVTTTDKTLSVLADWIRSVTEGKYVTIYERPIESVGSPASLLINFQPEPLPT